MKFNCATCHQPLASKRGLELHLKRYHPSMTDEPITCRTCKVPFLDKHNLKRHTLKFHRDVVCTDSESKSINELETMSSGEDSSINSGYIDNILNIAINQERNTGFIEQNTLLLGKILEITKELVRSREDCKTAQTEETPTKTYSCQICNRIYKNHTSLYSHRYKYHRVKSSVNLNCCKCNEIFTNERDLAIHNYRIHRVSL